MKLKECPFCGKVAILISNSGYEWGTGHHIKCANCSASSTGWHTKEQAIKAWNNRTPDPHLTEALEALREIRETLPIHKILRNTYEKMIDETAKAILLKHKETTAGITKEKPGDATGGMG